MTPDLLWQIPLNLGLIVLSAWAIYLIRREKLSRAITRRLLSRGAPNSTFRLAQQGQGFNPANIYFTLNYDCRTTDLVIRGLIPRAVYWSIVPYDRYTMPLNYFFSDATITREDQQAYTAFMTVRPQGRTNEMDVSASPRGLLIVRTSLPEDPEAVAANLPQVETVSPPG